MRLRKLASAWQVPSALEVRREASGDHSLLLPQMQNNLGVRTSVTEVMVLTWGRCGASVNRAVLLGGA